MSLEIKKERRRTTERRRMSNKDEEIEEAKRWFYAKYGKPNFFKRLYYRIKDRIAAWACGCDTFRGDAAIWLEWELNGPGKD